MHDNRWGFPDLGLGLGLRTTHYAHILSERPDIGFFEILTENYLDTGGRPLFMLDQISELYPTVMHGVSMSIGSTDPIDFDYLAKVKALADRTGSLWVSDHICWTGVLGRNTHDLLPLPYTEESLAHSVERIKVVQEYLERPLVLENPSAYLEFADDDMTEWEFVSEVARRADCWLLFDVNNVYVSSVNHGFSTNDFLHGVPRDRIVQFHVAGHSQIFSRASVDKDGQVVTYDHRERGLLCNEAVHHEGLVGGRNHLFEKIDRNSSAEVPHEVVHQEQHTQEYGNPRERLAAPPTQPIGPRARMLPPDAAHSTNGGIDPLNPSL